MYTGHEVLVFLSCWEPCIEDKLDQVIRGCHLHARITGEDTIQEWRHEHSREKTTTRRIKAPKREKENQVDTILAEKYAQSREPLDTRVKYNKVCLLCLPGVAIKGGEGERKREDTYQYHERPRR